MIAKPGGGPAGGSAAALTTVLASSLVRLVARVSSEWDEATTVDARATALCDRALLLADDDHRAYARALEQLADPKDDQTLGTALHGAALVPLQIAETAAEVAELAALATAFCAPAVRADAWAAATLAEAAGVSAARLVAVNLSTRPDDALRRRAETAAQSANASRARALDADS